MPLKIKKCSVSRSPSVHQQKIKNPNSGRRKPDWDDSVNDLTAYRATKDDLLRRKLLHQSSNTDLVKEDFLQKKIMQVIKKNSLASKGVFKELVQIEDDDSVVNRSSSANSRISSYGSQTEHDKNNKNCSSKGALGKENRPKFAKVKPKTSTGNDTCPVRILNDYKLDDEAREWEQVDDDDDDDDHSPVSSKSYLLSSKKNLDSGNESLCLRQLLAAVSVMSDSFEEVVDRLNVEMEKRREAEANLNTLSSSCRQMEKEISSLKDTISSMRKDMEINRSNGIENISKSKVNGFVEGRDLCGQEKCDDDGSSFIPDPTILRFGEQTAKNTSQKLATPLFAQKQIIGSLFPDPVKVNESEHQASKEKVKLQQFAELNRRKEEKLNELNRILIMEKTAHGLTS